MGFIRSFSDRQINQMTSGENAELFLQLKADVLRGVVFPAVRKNELHFYYQGGCLYKFSGGSFKRDKNFEKFGIGFEGLSSYEKAKKEIEVKFTNVGGKAKERRLLNELNCHTFFGGYGGSVVVLDIEVNLNGAVGGGKKCDLVLFNRKTDELAFVEGKVFFDPRVLVSEPFTPEVITQVNTYTAAISEQRKNIIEQYARHVEIVNELFKTSYRAPRTMIEPAKLLVYATPTYPTPNGVYTIGKINSALGAGNVLWARDDDRPTLDEIWNALTRQSKR